MNGTRTVCQPHKLKAEVAVLNYFSAHADEPGLLAFLGVQDRDWLQTVFLVHGDPERQEKLKEALGVDGFGDVAIPARGDSVTL